MSGETSQKALVAESVCKEIFEFFGWMVIGRTDFELVCNNHKHCVVNEKGVERRLQSHCIDGVLYYKDPITEKDICFITDLKNYSKISITKRLNRAASKLAQSISCAMKSDPFRSYNLPDDNGIYSLNALLFVHNEKRDFDGVVTDIIGEVDVKDMPEESVLFSVDRNLIKFWYSIQSDFLRNVGGSDDKDYDIENKFFYIESEGYKLKNERNPTRIANIEYLVSDVIVMKAPNKKYFLYTRQSLEKCEEFENIIDLIHKAGLLNSAQEIIIKSSYFDSRSRRCLDNAKNNFGKNLYGLSKEKLEPIKLDNRAMQELEPNLREEDISYG